jgi:ABC-2 type transport system ATP-binding protein
MIEAEGLTKHYGTKVAVDELSFSVRPGVVTGFLGPNGSGKSTTMRMIVGLDEPTRGHVTINGQRYHDRRGPCARSAHCSKRAPSIRDVVPEPTS